MPYFLVLIVQAVLINNFVLSRFLGICPFLGVSKKTETALGMGLAVIFVMSVASLITYLLDLLLVYLGVTFLRTIVFILAIAALVQILEIVVKKLSPSLYGALGVYLPLITTNCAVLGVAIMNVTELQTANVLYAVLNGAASGAGFMVAILLLAGIRERLETADIPKPFQGFPITLITASIMAMAFTAFTGFLG
jgi:electron transport complex protein RnfA